MRQPRLVDNIGGADGQIIPPGQIDILTVGRADVGSVQSDLRMQLKKFTDHVRGKDKGGVRNGQVALLFLPHLAHTLVALLVQSQNFLHIGQVFPPTVVERKRAPHPVKQFHP